MNYDELRKLRDKGPYDQSMELRMDMYDNIPYERDASFCNIENLTYGNSSIIKFYNYNVADTYYLIPKNYDKIK
jgi:hypothetical protein